MSRLSLGALATAAVMLTACFPGHVISSVEMTNSAMVETFYRIDLEHESDVDP